MIAIYLGFSRTMMFLGLKMYKITIIAVYYNYKTIIITIIITIVRWVNKTINHISLCYSVEFSDSMKFSFKTAAFPMGFPAGHYILPLQKIKYQNGGFQKLMYPISWLVYGNSHQWII